MSILSSAAGFLVQTAFAQMPPATPCPAGIPGCGGPSNIIFTGIIPNFITFLLRIVGALSVAAIVWYGLMLVANAGDETQVTKARYAVLYAALGIALSILSQVIVAFVISENYGQAMTGDFIVAFLGSVVRILVTVTNIVFALLIVYEGVRMVMSQGASDEYTKARKAILWSIIGAVLVNLAYEIVLLAAGFFGY